MSKLWNCLCLFGAYTACAVGFLSNNVHAAVFEGNPSNYRGLLGQLEPGDTLQLQAGEYDRLSISDLHGTRENWITISGPAEGVARILSDPCCNTVQIRRSSFVRVRQLVIDSGGNAGLDGINIKDGASHDLAIESNLITGVGGSQQTVGISTKSTVWNLQIRGNVIMEPGTGMYFGDSNGGAPFVAGVIEHNLVVNSIGYGMQIKHQNPYSLDELSGPQSTVVRHNVFIKDDRTSSDGSRPNLLLGTFPDQGQGATDLYEVYGNFIYHNSREALIQASGRVAIHHNLLVGMGAAQTGIFLTDHNGPLKFAQVFRNTIYGDGEGIRLNTAARESDFVFGNVIFGSRGVTGIYSRAEANLHMPPTIADNYLQAPSAVLGEMNFRPTMSSSLLTGQPALPAEFANLTDVGRDFDGRDASLRFIGAYAGGSPAWQPAATVKTLIDTKVPMPPILLDDE